MSSRDDLHTRFAVASRHGFTRPNGDPMQVDDLTGPSGTTREWVNRDTQASKPSPSAACEKPIPVYLRQGRNVLRPEHFEIAARRLLPKTSLRVVRESGDRRETALEIALRTGRFVFNGVECVRQIAGAAPVAESTGAA